ncbi:hypothetical protein K438DRAFT_1452286, partial [Mycena galopus ATCC 62051]
GPGGGGGGSNRPPSYKGYPHVAPGTPYGSMVPTIEPKLKVESLPTWDGSHATAIDYFWAVGELANLRGWMPVALGFWLPTHLVLNSDVQLWFSHLPISRQDEMRSHYLLYFEGIRDKFLGKRWLMTVNAEFDMQRFHQRGHEDEMPQRFIGRRIRSIRLLANTDDGGPAEVFLIMKVAPIKWSTILVLQDIQSSEELYERVNEHSKALIEAVQRDSSGVVTLNNLASNLKKLGFSSPPSNGHRPPYRRANLTSAEDESDKLLETKEEFSKDDQNHPADGADSQDGDETIKVVFQTLKKRQRPPPKGGYPFPKHDNVLTRMGRALPSPCKVCGSARHWDRECPDWNVYSEKVKRGLLVVSSEASEENVENGQDTEAEVLEEEVDAEEPNEAVLEPPPADPKVVMLKRKRNPKSGESALGISVLSVKGWIESTEEQELDLRIDSCADISLVSEEFHALLRHPPLIREGHHMNLAQLTDQGTSIKGYTKLKVFMPASSGEILESEVEAYVVKGMSVPILLGEDYQLNYELSVTQNVETGTKIGFGTSEFQVIATGVDHFAGMAQMHKIATGLTLHAGRLGQAKEHQRAKKQQRHRKLRNGAEGRTVRADTNYRVKPHESRVIGLSGQFSEDKTWLVESNLLVNSDDLLFSVPKTLISARKPCVPVSNLSDQPRIIRKGEILGHLSNSEDVFDKP